MTPAADWFDRLKQFDQRRPDLPGEHLLVLGIGLALLVASGKSRSFLARTLVGAAAGAFIGRAASGTGGVARVASYFNTRRPW